MTACLRRCLSIRAPLHQVERICTSVETSRTARRSLRMSRLSPRRALQLLDLVGQRRDTCPEDRARLCMGQQHRGPALLDGRLSRQHRALAPSSKVRTSIIMRRLRMRERARSKKQKEKDSPLRLPPRDSQRRICQHTLKEHSSSVLIFYDIAMMICAQLRLLCTLCPSIIHSKLFGSSFIARLSRFFLRGLTL